MSLAHCDVSKKLCHSWAGINRSQTHGACLVHPGVRDTIVSWPSYLQHGNLYIWGTQSWYWDGALCLNSVITRNLHYLIYMYMLSAVISKHWTIRWYPAKRALPAMRKHGALLAGHPRILAHHGKFTWNTHVELLSFLFILEITRSGFCAS